MPHDPHEMKFVATPEKGEVSALLIRPENATHLLVLGHGASTNMRHATLQAIAERLAEVGIATFRYNFPYSEHGKGRDSQAVCTATVRSAVVAAQRSRTGAAASRRRPFLRRPDDLDGGLGISLEGVAGLVFFSFPLHLAGKPDTKAGRSPRGRHGPDALPQRDARRAGGAGSPQARLQEARQSRDAPPPGHSRPRLQDPQEVPHERGGCLRRDGSRRAGLGVKAVIVRRVIVAGTIPRGSDTPGTQRPRNG